MAKKNILIQDVKHKDGSKNVRLEVNGHRYLVSPKVLADSGVKNVYTLRGKSIKIETYDVGEKMISGEAYTQKEDSTLVKRIVELPAYTFQELAAIEFASQMAAMMGFAAPVSAAAPAATPAAAIGTTEELADAGLTTGEAAPANAELAAVAGENDELPE